VYRKLGQKFEDLGLQWTPENSLKPHFFAMLYVCYCALRMLIADHNSTCSWESICCFCSIESCVPCPTFNGGKKSNFSARHHVLYLVELVSVDTVITRISATCDLPFLCTTFLLFELEK
jgi:hypothetical protein